MKAIQIQVDQQATKLAMASVDTPSVQNNEVLIRVRAIGMNRADILQRKGLYPAPHGYPADIPGLEFAGEVAAIGSSVQHWQVGDRVMGLTGGGAYAEYVCVHALELSSVPASWSWPDAASAPEGFMTAQDAIITQCNLRPNENLLVYGATGAVGLAAMQVGNLYGAKVFGVSRSGNKLAAASDYADFTPIVAGNDEELKTQLKAACPKGFDVVFDTVSGAWLPTTIKQMAHQGRLSLIGMLAGAKANLPLGIILSKRLQIHGSVLRSRSIDEKIRVNQLFVQEILPRLGDKKPRVDKVFQWDNFQAATDYFESGEHVGKVVMTVDA